MFLKLKIFNKHFYNVDQFNFSKISARDKEKKLSGFFKLPKHDLSHEKILEKNFDEDELAPSILRQYKSNENVDKIELATDAFRRKREQANTDTEKFFQGLNDQETIKLTENILD